MQQRYPIKTLYGDYIRSAIGLAVFGTPLAFVSNSPVWSTILGGFFVLFLIFGIRTLNHQMTVVETSATGIATTGPLGKTFKWSEIEKVELSYYSTRRDKQDGWMQLSLFGPPGKMKLESSLEDFNAVAEMVIRAGFENSAEMGETTIENITNLGITLSYADET